MQAMLGHGDRDQRQLRNLMALRRGRLDALALAEGTIAAAAPNGPVLDQLVELLERKQPPVPAFVPGLATRPAPARRRPRPRRRRGRILRRRQRGVTRGTTQPLLKLADPRLEPPVRHDQLVHPQKQCDRCLLVTVENRLSLGPLHTPEFAPPKRVPSRGGERLPFRLFGGVHRGLAPHTGIGTRREYGCSGLASSPSRRTRRSESRIPRSRGRGRCPTPPVVS